MGPFWSRCGLIGGNVSLERTLRFQKTHSKPRDSSFWLPLDLDVELSATMSGYHHDPPQEDNEVNLWNHKPQSNAFLVRVAIVEVSSLCSNRTLSKTTCFLLYLLLSRVFYHSS